MATWAIGDVHGCAKTLAALLARPELGRDDRLWFVGDLVNRGPRSHETLRRVVDLGERASVVLGNHDVHLLGRAAGVIDRGKLDTLDDLLEAPDCDELVGWLSGRRLLLRGDGLLMVHAGLLADWDPVEAERRAARVEATIASADRDLYLAAFRADSDVGPVSPAIDWQVVEDLRVFTLMRTVDERGTPTYDYTGTLAELPPHRLPWFDLPGCGRQGLRVVCGHWAALGLYVRDDVLALDSGCAWGGPLSACRLEDGRIVQVENLDR